MLPSMLLHMSALGRSPHSPVVKIELATHTDGFDSNSEFRLTKVPAFHVVVCLLRLLVALCHNPLKFGHRYLYLLLCGHIHYQQVQDILLEDLLDDALLPLTPWPSCLPGFSWCSATSHSPLVLVLSLPCPAILPSSAALLASGGRVDIPSCEQRDQRATVSSMVRVAEARGEARARIFWDGER